MYLFMNIKIQYPEYLQLNVKYLASAFEYNIIHEKQIQIKYGFFQLALRFVKNILYFK